MFCRSLFVLLYFFVWPLCCLFFFDIRILITPLVSSNYSCQWLWIDHAWLYLRVSLTSMLRVSLTFIVVNLYLSSPNHHSHVNASIPTWYCHPNHHSHVNASIPTWYCHSWFLRSVGKDQNVINSERIPWRCAWIDIKRSFVFEQMGGKWNIISFLKMFPLVFACFI